MIKAPYFKLAGRLQAVKADTFRREYDGIETPDGLRDYWRYQVNAVWYRRRKGVTVACWGTLEGFHPEHLETVTDWLPLLKDGRYGPTCRVRWDGNDLWTYRTDFATASAVMTGILAPMLRGIGITRAAAHTKPPPGWDGWWTWGADES